MGRVMRSERSRSQLRAEARGVRRARQVMARPAPSPTRRSGGVPIAAIKPSRVFSRRRASVAPGAIRVGAGVRQAQSVLIQSVLAARRRKSGGEKLADWAKTQVGVKQGDRAQVRYTKTIPMSFDQPWCAAFINYGLRKQGKRGPAQAAYSGAWLNWKGGKRVAKAKRGDLVVYDWGDGGMTDHIAIYEGNNRVIGGNQNKQVTRAPAKLDQAIGIIRPK